MAESELVWTQHVMVPPAPRYPYHVPGCLWAADESISTRTSLLPRHLKSVNSKFKPVDFSVPAERARAYAALLKYGRPDQIYSYLDGDALVEVWAEMILPRDVRAAWAPIVADWKERK